MLRLQNHLLCATRAASHAATSPIHRFHLSTTTAAAEFVAEDYLVASCGLAPAQALKASKHLRHLKSPTKPDAVRAYLADAGIAEADIASAIAWDPRFLCYGVDKTLTPRIAWLRDIGLSAPQISRLVAIVPGVLLKPAYISRIQFYISMFCSYEKLEAVLKRSLSLLHWNIDGVLKPNMAFLRRCELSEDDIAGLFLHGGRLLTSNLEHLKEMVARAENNLGVERSSGMFKAALVVVGNSTPQRISANMGSLERALGYSEAKMAVYKLPNILNLSEVTMAHRVEFLRMEFGLEPSYIAHRPAILKYSLEKRLIPRHYAIQILKAKGLVKRDIDLFSVFCCSHEKFVETYLHRPLASSRACGRL